MSIRGKDNANNDLLQFCEEEVMSYPTGRWGHNMNSLGHCVYDCDKYRNISETCRISDDCCYTGCKEGLWGESCNQACNCVDDTSCRQSDGYCETGCKVGFWGGSCDEQCDCRDGAPCNQTNGTCPPRKSEHEILFPFFI